MEERYILEEKDPPTESTEKNKLVWKQGYFSFGTQKRIANITAAKFITNDLIIIAHRAIAKVYLIKIVGKKYEIIDSLLLKFGKQYFHPDGMDLYNNKIYISAFTDKCCVVEILNQEELVFERLFSVVPRMAYHGVCVNDNGIYLGSCATLTDTMPIHFYNPVDANIIEYDTHFRRRIKGLQWFNDGQNLIVASDDKDKGRRNLFDSFIVHYTLMGENKLAVTDEFKMEHSQVDGIIMKEMIWYSTIHDADDKCGYVVVGTVGINGKLIFLSKIKCDNFPHGIDITNDFLVFTCYGNSSFTIRRENQTKYWSLK